MGDNVRIVVIDEAAYTPFRLFTLLVGPMLQLVGTALVMISTRTGNPDDPFNEMINMKYLDEDGEETDEYAFRAVVWDSVCNECKAAGIEAELCRHRELERPPWIQRNNRFLRRVYRADPAAYKTEILGIVDGGESLPMFDKASITKMFSPENIFTGQVKSKYVFIATDPCGTNTSGKSLYSSVALAFVEHKPVVSSNFHTIANEFQRVRLEVPRV